MNASKSRLSEGLMLLNSDQVKLFNIDVITLIFII